MKFKLVVFDVDGVLTEVESIWRYLHRKLGTLKQAEVNAKAYYNGLISYEEWAKRDVALWRGIPKEVLISIVNNIPLRRGARDLISFLKAKGLIVVALSAGLSLITRRIKDVLGLDRELSNDLIFDKNGKVSGDVVVKVRADNKGLVLKKLLNEYNLTGKECIAVGDSEVDIPMFKEVGLSVAFSPKDIKVAEAADVTIYGDLSKLLYLFKLILN